MLTDNIVKTVIIMMNFFRGGHEGDWVLHSLAAEVILPYFCSVGCHNYARYAALYVHHVKGHDPVMMMKLQYGAFVHHIPGIYNSTWMDKFVETTYLWLGQGQTGDIGVATDYHHMVKWVLSFVLSGEISQCSICEQH